MRRALPAMAACLLLLAACSDITVTPVIDGITTPIATPSWSLHIAPVLRETCGSSGACHGGATPQRGLLLEGSDTVMYNQLVDVPSTFAPTLFLRVKPGQPDSSFFLMMMSETSTVRLGRPRMPMTSEPMPLAIRLTIRNWIQQGAPNN